jgi:hypothetical protein
MRYKYIEEEYPHWFTVNDETVIAHNTDREDFVPVIDERAIKEHSLVVEKLCEIACAWAESDHDAFANYWYGPEKI